MTPHPERLQYLRYALTQGYSIQQLARLTGIDPWFLHQMNDIADLQAELEKRPDGAEDADLLRNAKRYGFSDARLGQVWHMGRGFGGGQ